MKIEINDYLHMLNGNVTVTLLDGEVFVGKLMGIYKYDIMLALRGYGRRKAILEKVNIKEISNTVKAEQ